MNRNKEVNKLGQSFWYDNVQRSLIANGEMQTLINDYGVLGVTSNPSIFEKAISQSADYDNDIIALTHRAETTEAIYEALTIADIQAVADLLAPIHEQTKGKDGYISLEVSPLLARNAEGTIKEARRLAKKVDRKNLMIKVPATPECIPAIRQLIEDGINVNVTLIFSLDNYEQVVRAYIAGLQARAKKNKSLNIASVASFFVSRVDTLVDKLLAEKIAAADSDKEKAKLESLKHKSAIANAKLAYERFEKISKEKIWRDLASNGAQPQRVLWASTSTKNPALPAVYYADALIGADTVNTLPPATLKAFFEEGTVAPALTRGIKDAHRVMADLAAAGIDMHGVWQKLQDDGVTLFSDAYKALINSIEQKRAAVIAGGVLHHPGLTDGYADELIKMNAAARIWNHDASFWTNDPDHIKVVNNRLGWLSVIAQMKQAAPELVAFRQELINDGITDVIVLGMGGSSLAPDLIRIVFDKLRTPGLNVHVLDTTDPTTIAHLESNIDLCKTVFIVSSKSGGTIEVTSFYEHFRSKMDDCRGEASGSHFVAITDENTKLQEMSANDQFRRVFINPSDIGGRYSALSYFGLVPAALMGVDIAQMLERAEQMAAWCKYNTAVNPGLMLGALMGSSALDGRDKITLIISPQIAAYGAWAEQLIAESTGKQERGIVPVDGDITLVKSVADISEDRLFISLQLKGDDTHEKLIAQLKRKQAPLLELKLNDVYDTAAEFFRWEFATAVAGAIIGVDPFDEPNVTESKLNTKRLLEEHEATGAFAIESSSRSANGQLNKFLRSAKHGDYISIQAYLPYLPEIADQLEKVRAAIITRFGAPVTLGYGPRFLHSTGQLHKGGANNVVALQFTYDTDEDVLIPGEPYSFGTLIRAQALGDFESLKAHNRRVMRLHLGRDITPSLRKITRTLRGGARTSAPIAKAKKPRKARAKKA